MRPQGPNALPRAVTALTSTQLKEKSNKKYVNPSPRRCSARAPHTRSRPTAAARIPQPPLGTLRRQWGEVGALRPLAATSAGQRLTPTVPGGPQVADPPHRSASTSGRAPSRSPREKREQRGATARRERYLSLRCRRGRGSRRPPASPRSPRLAVPGPASAAAAPGSARSEPAPACLQPPPLRPAPAPPRGFPPPLLLRLRLLSTARPEGPEGGAAAVHSER